jgi:hypothetical protein
MGKRYTLEQIRAMKGQTDWKALKDAADFEGNDDDDFDVDFNRAKIVDGSTLTTERDE